MSVVTIYATAKQKLKEGFGCYAITILEEGKTAQEYKGHFDSKSVPETQLKILNQSISHLEKPFDLKEIKILTDFSVVEKFSNGTVKEWKSKDWVNSQSKTMQNIEEWDGFLKSYEDLPITFIKPPSSDSILKSTKELLRKEIENLSKEVITEEISTEDVKAKSKTATKEKKSRKKVESNPEEKTPETLTEKRVKSSTVSTTEITENILPKSGETDSIIIIDQELKAKCETLFEEIGLDLETAITVFLKHSIRKKGLTLDLKLEEN